MHLIYIIDDFLKDCGFRVVYSRNRLYTLPFVSEHVDVCYYREENDVVVAKVLMYICKKHNNDHIWGYYTEMSNRTFKWHDIASIYDLEFFEKIKRAVSSEIYLVNSMDIHQIHGYTNI